MCMCMCVKFCMYVCISKEKEKKRKMFIDIDVVDVFFLLMYNVILCIWIYMCVYIDVIAVVFFIYI